MRWDETDLCEPAPSKKPDLVASLRKVAATEAEIVGLMRDAADRIESDAAEIAKLREDLKNAGPW